MEAYRQLPANLRAAMAILRANPLVADAFALDEMAQVAILRSPLPARGTDDVGNGDDLPRPVRDTDVSALQEWLQGQDGLSRISKATCHDAVDLRAAEHAFHPIRDWLGGLTWDGLGRLDRWVPAYLGTEETPYSRGIGARFLTSMVARVFEPGCKADHRLSDV